MTLLPPNVQLTCKKDLLSWSVIPDGGMVITAAAAEAKNVKALVYIAAFAPDTGESAGALLKRSKAPDELGPALAPDAGGFLYVNREKFHDVFAKDLSPSEARIAAATQKPIFGGIFEIPVEAAAWKKYSFVVCRRNRRPCHQPGTGAVHGE